MGIIRKNFLVGLCVATLVGCGQSRFPDVTSSFSEDVRRAGWPGFLPKDMILSSELTDFDQAQSEINNLRSRVLRLRRRAKLLQGPVVTVQERLRMRQAVNQNSQ